MFSKCKALTKRTFPSEIIFRITKYLINYSDKKSIYWLRKQVDFFSRLFERKRAVKINEVLFANGVATEFEPEYLHLSQQKIIYFHGGGFVLEGGQFYKQFCQVLAQQSNMCVVLLNYRLAPEHVYPAAHDDCFNLVQSYVECYPSTNFHFIGDSAGGALLLSTFQKCVALRIHSLISSMVLISPWLDAYDFTEQVPNYQMCDCIAPHHLTRWFNMYYTNVQGAKHAEQAFNFPYETLPQVLVQFAKNELLAVQIYTFIRRALRHETSVEVDEVAEGFHNFQVLGLLTKEGQLAMKKIVRFIKKNADTVS